jgi:hypothetical protein
MSEPDGTYVFEVLARLLMSANPTSALDEFHRALAQTAMEAVLDGRDGYSVQGVRKDGVGFVRVQVPARVAEDGKWLLRRSVL